MRLKNFLQEESIPLLSMRAALENGNKGKAILQMPVDGEMKFVPLMDDKTPYAGEDGIEFDTKKEAEDWIIENPSTHNKKKVTWKRG